MPRTDFLFPSFDRGLVDALASNTAPVNGLSVCKNVDFGKPPIGGVTIRPPIWDGQITPRILHPNTEQSCKRLIRFDANQSYFWIGSTGLIYGIDHDVSFIYTVMDSEFSLDHSYIIIDDTGKVYFFGNKDVGPVVLEHDEYQYGPNIQWQVRQLGFKSKVFVGTAGTDGSMDAGDYHYQLILTDTHGHKSVPLEQPISFTVAGTGSVAFEGLPSCGGDYKFLYRSPKNANKINPLDPENPLIYYLVEVLTGGQVNYKDKMADSMLVTHELLILGDYGLPPNLINAALFNGRMFGTVYDTSILRYSQLFDYENWPVLNSIPLGDGSFIRFILPLGDRLLIFKSSKVYGFWGSDNSNFDFRELTNQYGIGWTQTAKAIDETRAIFMDNQRRVIMYDANSGFAEISKAIKIPESIYYWASIIGDYYVLWCHDIYAGLPTPTDDPPPDPPPNDEPYPPDDPRDPHDPPHDPDNPRHDDYVDQQPTTDRIVGYAFHVLTGAWSKWEGIHALTPQTPDRGGVDNFTYWDGLTVKMLNKKYGDLFYDDMEIRTIDTDCGLPLQEKAFKEVELDFKYTGNEDFNGTIGTLDVIVDEEGETEAQFQTPIIFDSTNPDERQRFRIRNGINGKRIALRFQGTPNMKDFSLLNASVAWEPRGTAIR